MFFFSSWELGIGIGVVVGSEARHLWAKNPWMPRRAVTQQPQNHGQLQAGNRWIFQKGHHVYSYSIRAWYYTINKNAVSIFRW